MTNTTLLTDFDRYLMGEGSYERAYEKMGAQLVELDGQAGVHFAVWAPNARQIFVMGDFNQWHGESHPEGCKNLIQVAVKRVVGKNSAGHLLDEC